MYLSMHNLYFYLLQAKQKFYSCEIYTFLVLKFISVNFLSKKLMSMLCFLKVCNYDILKCVVISVTGIF